MINLLKNKLFIILILSISLLYFVGTSCFASIDVTYKDTTYTLELPDDTLPYYLILAKVTSSGTGYFDVYSSSSPIKYYYESGQHYICYEKYSYYNYKSDIWYRPSVEHSGFSESVDYKPDKFICSNYDILDKNTNEVVFQGAPQVEVKGQLTQVVEHVEMEKTLAEVIHLLPIVMIIVVSLLALYKGLRILYHFLVTS